ncbi:MAG TPA: YbaB/EbfC family nucleoid-associated protein [Mycobacterium sp.]|nr:YbaB/EbfC family nucleoid-associated protein [Mycobacterium sp.]
MSNDELRHEMTEVLALVQEQLADIAAMQQRQAELTSSAAVADGMVEVTVNAAGHVIDTVIDESYLDEHEFEELPVHITQAAQAAARDVARRVNEMMVPINERRKRFPSLSEFVDGAPDLRDLAPPWPQPVAAPSARHDHDDDDGREESAFPTVRR